MAEKVEKRDKKREKNKEEDEKQRKIELIREKTITKKERT